MDQNIAIVAFAAIVSGTMLIGSVVRTVSRHYERRAERQGRDEEGLAQVRAELAELRAQVVAFREEVVELQERMEFTERLLARAREPERLKS